MVDATRLADLHKRFDHFCSPDALSDGHEHPLAVFLTIGQARSPTSNFSYHHRHPSYDFPFFAVLWVDGLVFRVPALGL